MKRTTPLLSIACTLALSMVLLIGCTDIFHPPKKVTAVAIDQARPLMVGETSQLTATITPADATNKQVSWTSSNPDIATVDSQGLVTAVSRGDAEITVTAESQDKSDSILITVHNGYVSISFTNTSDPDDTYSFWLTSGPAQGSDPARYTTFTEYEVPSHTIRDMGGGDGSHLLASSSPMDEEYGEYIPSDGNYPFDSFVMYVPGAINASCIGIPLDAARFTISRRSDALHYEFSAGYSSLPAQHLTVTFTEFGSDYVGGTISGVIANSTEYTVSGDFRVLRALYNPVD